MKYRIVCRNKNPWDNYCRDNYSWYYAQFEVFGVWIDCRYNPLVNPYDTFDSELEVVERWVNNKIERIPRKEEVVKTYD